MGSYSETVPTNFQSATIPLHMSVSAKIKEKIWNLEFVDFSTAFQDNTMQSFSLAFSENGVASVVSQPKKKFLTIEDWTDAFAKFSSV